MSDQPTLPDRNVFGQRRPTGPPGFGAEAEATNSVIVATTFSLPSGATVAVKFAMSAELISREEYPQYVTDHMERAGRAIIRRLGE